MSAVFGGEKLREIARGTEGSLADVPYAVLLAALAVEKRDCLAVLTHRRTQKRIVLSRGAPVDCRSNLVHETFGRFLVAQRKITEDQFALAHAQSQARGTLLGELLVEQGLLGRDEVLRLLQQNLAKKLLDGFTWREGTYALVADPPPVLSPLKVNVAQLIVTGVAKFAPQGAVDAAAGALVGKRLMLAPDPPFPLEEIRLSESQSRLAAALAKSPRIDELATEARLSFEEITRLLYALSLLGTVVAADGTRPVAPAAPQRAPAAEPPKAERPPAAPDRAREILREYEGFRGRDAFELLGAPEDAGDAAILARYLERAAAWAPWHVPHEDVREKATALFAAAARAFARLSDPEARAALLRARHAPEPGPARAAANAFAIKTDLLDSEAQHRKGEELLESGNLKQALPYLEFAADCDPQNGSYAADLSWCRFLGSNRTTSGTTLAELQEAIRIDPKSGIACFYAGEILRARGETARAEEQYRKAARLMAPDRRALDALREMSRSTK